MTQGEPVPRAAITFRWTISPHIVSSSAARCCRATCLQGRIRRFLPFSSVVR